MQTTVKAALGGCLTIRPCVLTGKTDHVTVVFLSPADLTPRYARHLVLSPEQAQGLIAALEATLQEASGVVA